MWRRIAGSVVGVGTAVLALKCLNREKPMFISKERANRAWKDTQMGDPEEHAYRLRVRDRIMTGDSCTHPPLYNGSAAKPRIQLVGRANYDKACTA